jgi:hypothetical protein
MLRVGDEVRIIGGQDGMLGKEGTVVYVPPAAIASPPCALVRLVSVTHASGAPADYVARWYNEKDMRVTQRRTPLGGMVKAVGGPCDGGELSGSLSPLHLGPQLMPAGDAEVSGTYQLTRLNMEGEPATDVMMWHAD